MSGIVAAVDLEKGLVFVSLGAPEISRLMGKSRGFREAQLARWRELSSSSPASSASAAVPSTEAGTRAATADPFAETIVAVRIGRETKLKLEDEVEGTLMPVRKGTPVEVEGSITRAAPDAEETLVMDAVRVTVRSACVPDGCHKSGSCRRKCGAKPCKCAK